MPVWLNLVSIAISAGCICYSIRSVFCARKVRKERRNGRNRPPSAAHYSSTGHPSSTPSSSALAQSNTSLAFQALSLQAAIKGTSPSVSMSGGPPPGNATRDDEAIPDIEIGRKALRTFQISRMTKTAHSPTPYTFVPNDYSYQLKSLYGNHTWDGGKAIATCRRGEYGNAKGSAQPCESPPGEDCRCGLYGTLTIDQLIKEYGNAIRSNGCIAVFTAEGDTVIGSAGLRTAAARIVGYWVSTENGGYHNAEQAFKEQCPEAKKCDTIAELLSEFGFEPFKSTRLAKTAEEALTQDHARYSIVRPSVRSAAIPAPASWYPTPVSPSSVWSRLAPLLTAATPGGIAAIQALAGGGGGGGSTTTTPAGNFGVSQCHGCGKSFALPAPNQVYLCAACISNNVAAKPQAKPWKSGDDRAKKKDGST